MFGTVLFGMIIAAGAVIAGHLLGSIVRRGRGGEAPAVRGLGLLGTLVYVVMVASVAVLAVTSIKAMLEQGSMRGWMLWFHLGAAGAFVVTLMLATLLWTAACDVCVPDEQSGGVRFAGLTRWSFWIFLVAALVSLTTTVLSMLHLLNTHEIEWMMAVHRYSGLVVVGAIVVHLYSVSLGRIVAGHRRVPA